MLSPCKKSSISTASITFTRNTFCRREQDHIRNVFVCPVTMAAALMLHYFPADTLMRSKVTHRLLWLMWTSNRLRASILPFQFSDVTA